MMLAILRDWSVAACSSPFVRPAASNRGVSTDPLGHIYVPPCLFQPLISADEVSSAIDVRTKELDT
jgi:hypothetical protein